MSTLTPIEKRKLEQLLQMGGGYVLDFSNRSFHDFVLDSTGCDIFADKYVHASSSKANRLRAFWTKESDPIVGKLLIELIQYAKESNPDPKSAYDECHSIAQRLLKNRIVPDLEAFAPISDSRTFETLAKTVRESIERNEPESGLDRLHTFVVMYVRRLCVKHGIATDREKPLHSLFGEYIRYLKRSGLIESEMTERILKSSISILEAFNHVRNEQSLAHDNPILGYSESLLIFNNVASSIRFLAVLEESIDLKKLGNSDDSKEDIPF